jgi:mono/diheme cytochrome c family protein
MSAAATAYSEYLKIPGRRRRRFFLLGTQSGCYNSRDSATRAPQRGLNADCHCQEQQKRKTMNIKPIKTIALMGSFAAALAFQPVAQAEAPYQVDGNKVDKITFSGWKIYKRQRCETCHGPTAEGAAAFPNLVNSLKNLDKAAFTEVVLNGRNAMPAFKDNQAVAGGIDGLYAFLKGRSDGAIPPGELQEMQ